MRTGRARNVLAFLFSVAASLSLARSAGASCTASLSMSQDHGILTWQAKGNGSCSSPAQVHLSVIDVHTGLEVYSNTCIDSPCASPVYSGPAYCANPPDISYQLAVTCGHDVSVNGQTKCEADDPGYDSQSVQIDYQPSISAGEGMVSDGGTGISAMVSYQTPASWDRYLEYEALPSHTPVFGTTPISGPALDGSFLFGGPLPPGTAVVKVTIVSCQLKTASTFVGVNDNGCSQCKGACVGSPVRIVNGNMRMTDSDPLPSLPSLPLTRTYDSNGTMGLFGSGWVSLFDASFQTFTSHEDTFVMVMTDGASRYIFRRVGSAYVQAWPTGSTTASLSYDAASGTYVLREPLRDIELVARASDGVPLVYRSRSTGRQLSISYAGGLPVHVDDSWGHWGWTVTTDASSRLITGIALDGTANTWAYSYSAPGPIELTAVNGPGGALWRTYTYASGRLTSATDAAGHLLESHSYDATGRATTSISTANDISSIGYQVLSRGYEYVTRVTTAAGAVTDYYHQLVGGRDRTTQIDGHCSSCGTNDSVFAYDNAGRLVREQDARGYVTIRTYDRSDRMVSETVGSKPAGCDPETDSTRCRLLPSALATASLDTTAAAATTTYAYGDSNWPDRPTTVTSASVASPSQSRTQSLAYDAVTGAVLQETVTGWKSPQESTSITSVTALYDGVSGAAFDPGGAFLPAWLVLPQPKGLKRSFDGPRTDVSDVTQWVYYPVDAQVPGVLRGNLAAVRDAAGNVTRFETYDAFGNATRVVDPNGVATESTYDAAGRPLTTAVKGISGCDTTADPLCATDLVTQRAYAPALGPIATETRPGGGTTSYEYDARGRVTATTRSVSAVQSERAEYDYDAATGQKSAERYLSGSTGAWNLAHSEAFRYDIYGRLAEIDHPDNTKVYYTYDGANNVAAIRDENHTTPNTLYRYDPVNRLASVSQTLTAAPGGQIATGYAYDLAGNLISVTDPNGNVTSYSFDDFGRLLQQVSPVTGTTTYSYDPAGNLTATTDANGATTKRTYDTLGRALTATSMCSGSDAEVVNWTYDDPAAGAYGRGRLALMTDPSGSTAYRYERRGLLAREDRLIGDWQTVTDYAYDGDGNRVKLGNLEYAYDLAGRPVSAALRDCPTCSPSALVSSATYLPFGPERQLTFANGTVQSKAFDSRYRIQENKLAGPGGMPIADYTYTADGTGNITAIHDAIDASFDRTFTYDDLNRLVTASTGTSLWGSGAYAYDAMGNMLSATLGARTEAFTYVGSTPRIATSIEQGVSSPVDYDAAGNELDSILTPPPNSPVDYTNNIVSRWYSCRNLPASVSTSPAAPFICPPERPHCNPPMRLMYQHDYTYDGRGVRVAVTEETTGEATSYIYTPELHLLLARGASSDARNEYVWFNGRPVAQATSDPAEVRFTFTDHLGTPIVQTDAAPTVVWRAEYEPYGRVYQLRAGRFEDQRLRLPGQEIAEFSDQGSEENYNIFRWYRSGWGRYTQPDPLGLAGSANLFGYVDENPTNFSDPLGLIKPVPTSKQKWRPCNSDETARCQASCKYGMESCMVSQTFRVIRAKNGMMVHAWVDGPMSCSCKEPDCWDKLKDWAKRYLPDGPKPIPPLIPLPPFEPPPMPEPVIPGMPPFFINPCRLNPGLPGCSSPGFPGMG